jgi:hypothetical protein
MDKKSRKDLVREYAERKQPIGVYAVRCAASGEVWVGSTKNLDKKQNALWFQLKMGGSTEKAFQAAWNAHGEASFSYEILETITEDNPHTLQTLLPERESAWLEKLGASRLRGA